MICRAALGGVFGQLHHVIDHHAVLLTDWRAFIIPLQRLNHFSVQCYATQKLCVRLDSIVAAVGDRHHGGNHFVLVAGQRQIGRQQNAIGAEGVEDERRAEGYEKR